MAFRQPAGQDDDDPAAPSSLHMKSSKEDELYNIHMVVKDHRAGLACHQQHLDLVFEPGSLDRPQKQQYGNKYHDNRSKTVVIPEQTNNWP
ncbi:hypothetical protein LTR09_010274 [Extremus antarcticus]|uniref:Uncharacterized protein n=1 Tax=Extremus antarcticus TaxID=702011 RepID=A0AAJ0G8U6_9PEZI|nr:hypothetical protein LTR09_010274 [Extremus antarcticus]